MLKIMFSGVIMPLASQGKFHRKLVVGLRQNVSTAVSPEQKRELWESVVGLEVHAQISSRSKLFSGSSTKFGGAVNTHVSLFDAAVPGTLPVLNKRCVEAGVLTALAMSSEINLVSEFDRKHYFYADLPAGYQITQQRKPLAVNGHLNFIVFNSAVHKMPYTTVSRLKQIQLEQDSGKSLHDEYLNGSLIDLNRAGIGLMELVFEPDLKDGEEAAALVAELVRILRRIGTCDCKMEEGSLRVDANISVRRPGEPLGTRTEVKNINSLRSIAKAIDFEIERQIEILTAGGEVHNETRSYDPELKGTVPMRDKEMKQDYRFMPEPNLPPLRLARRATDETSHLINIEEIQKRIPVLPEEQRSFLMKEFNLPLVLSLQLVNDDDLHRYFLDAMKSKSGLDGKLMANIITVDLLGLLNKADSSISQSPVKPETLAEIGDLYQKGMISHSARVNLLCLVFNGDQRHPLEIVEDNGWTLNQNEELLEKLCQQVLSENPKVVEAYRKGKTKMLNSLLGQLRKLANNQVDMALASKKLKELADKTS